MVVETYHDASAARQACDEFDRVFSRRESPTDMPEICISAATIGIVDLIMQAGFAPSTSQARRLVEQGSASIDGVKITDIKQSVEPRGGAILKVGKRRFGRIRRS
jgi:tyrosyl-tRNA synthetase